MALASEPARWPWAWLPAFAWNARRGGHGQTRPRQAMPDEPKPRRTMANQLTPDATTPGQTNPGQTRPGKTRPSQTRPDQARATQNKPELTRPEQARSGQTSFFSFSGGCGRPDQVFPASFFSCPSGRGERESMPCKINSRPFFHLPGGRADFQKMF